jgi:hypothetical protein
MNFDNYSLVIVIGLSHSGKTTYCKNSIASHFLYDDFIPSFYEGMIPIDLINKKKIVLNDPRLCNFNIFKSFMEIFENYVAKEEILLVLFENNPLKCIANITTSKNVENNIIHNSKIYNLDNYMNYNYIII